MHTFRVPNNANHAGLRGEAAAALFLQRRGYTILARNFRTRYGEIDIVARAPDALVFVEVKARQDNRFGAAEAAVDARKYARVLRAATAYVREAHVAPDTLMRFDVVSVGESSAGALAVRHYPGVSI